MSNLGRIYESFAKAMASAAGLRTTLDYARLRGELAGIQQQFLLGFRWSPIVMSVISLGQAAAE